MSIVEAFLRLVINHTNNVSLEATGDAARLVIDGGGSAKCEFIARAYAPAPQLEAVMQPRSSIHGEITDGFNG